MKMARMGRVARLSFKNILQYKLRAFLTVLGIIFGVCSVVAMLSVGAGASEEIQEQLRRLGSSNILIQSVKLPEEQFSGGQTNTSRVASYGITYDDADQLGNLVPYLKSITPIKEISETVRYGAQRAETRILATVPWYTKVTNHRMQKGRFLTKKDLEERAAVCVIGARLARNLFTAVDPIGEVLRVGEDNVYEIVGVIGDVYSTEDFTNKPLWFEGENQDVIVPLTTYRTQNGDMFVKFGGGSGTMERVELHRLVLTVNDDDNVMIASNVARDVLAKNRQRKDYDIIVPLQLIRQQQETRRMFNIVLGSIAAISLIVGGIGIMNIMLATVSERTREIGIRRALGAHRRDIIFQFMVETLLLSISGGLIGLLFGVIIPKGLTVVTGMRTLLTPESFIVAFGVSVVVGLIFGIYPARRAAMMDPIEALRHE